MRTRRCLRVVLHREYRVSRVPHPLDGLVIQVDMGKLHTAAYGINIYGKVVVLGRDRHLSCGEFHDRLISPVMAKPQLVGLPSQGKPQDLMPEADAEYRLPANTPFDIPDSIGH